MYTCIYIHCFGPQTANKEVLDLFLGSYNQWNWSWWVCLTWEIGKWLIYLDCLFSGLSENCVVVVMKQYSSYRRLITVKPLILEVDRQFVKLTRNTALGISSPESDCNFTSKKNPGFPGYSLSIFWLRKAQPLSNRLWFLNTSSCSICSKT